MSYIGKDKQVALFDTYERDQIDGFLDTKYDPNSILGTVSQSSGVPTGAIIERGSNSNGDYVKFADGTLICTTKVVQSSAGASASGNLHSSTGTDWTYPVSFLDTPVISAFVDKIDIADAGVNPISVSRPTGGGVGNYIVSSLYIWYSGQSSTVKSRIALKAIGRWF